MVFRNLLNRHEVDSGSGHDHVRHGTDRVDPFRRAVTYVDRILRGEKPGDLPVQFPTKFEMVVNRRTVTALGRKRDRFQFE